MSGAQMDRNSQLGDKSDNSGPTGLNRQLALASLRSFETPLAGYYPVPAWLTDVERATLPPAFDSSRGGPNIMKMNGLE